MNYQKLIGLTIEQAEKKLGDWWIVSSVHANPPIVFFHFERAPCGHLDLRTKNNVVVSEHHNGYAEKLSNNKRK